MKKNYSSIGEWVKRNGVSFLVSDGVCIDIKVEPSTEEVDFGVLDGIRLNFFHNAKSFPSVKRLKFGGDNELSIEISNTLFPNVREIVSTNPRYSSGTMLIEKISETQMFLRNAFCLKENEPLDLKGITDIDKNALIGCKSNQIIHTESVVWALAKAFEKSDLACVKEPFIDGVKMAGTIVCDFDKSAEKYVIPDYATSMAIFSDYNMQATMIVKCNKAFFRMGDSLFYGPYNLVFMGMDHVSELSLRSLRRYNIKIRPDHPEYTTIDDIVYTKDMRRVVVCPVNKTGNIIIEKGTEEIGRHAFEDCNVITSVQIPDSVKKIEAYAFKGCTKLRSVTFGKNINQIEKDCFANDECLTEIELPGTLNKLDVNVFSDGGTLETVKINEGTKTIERAFLGTRIKKIFIPSSFEGFDKYDYIGACTIIFASDDIPDDIVTKTDATKIITPSHVIYLPSRTLITREARDEINSLLNSHKSGFAEPLYKTFGKNPKLKRTLAFQEYEVLPNEETKKYLKRAGKALATEFIDKNEAENLAKLIQYDVLSVNALEQISKAIDEIGYVDLLGVKKLISNKIGENQI